MSTVHILNFICLNLVAHKTIQTADLMLLGIIYQSTGEIKCFLEIL